MREFIRAEIKFNIISTIFFFFEGNFMWLYIWCVNSMIRAQASHIYHILGITFDFISMALEMTATQSN